MAIKISETEWVDFTKKVIKDGKLDPKLKLDDAALVKALAAYDKTEASKPEPHLKALDELIKQIPEQVKALVKRKKELGDKPFGQLKDKLYELLEAAEGQRKTAMDKAAEAKAAESKGKGKADEDDEEETPALLTTKMIPLLRELKKGEVTMPCLIALAGKETVVLLSRKPISPARGKLLKEQMEKPTGLKFIRGDSMYEKGALTFVVQSPGAALAKRLRQALLDQTQLRLRVKVRGEDGVEELDGEEENLEQEGTQTQKAPPGGPASAEQLAYTQRLLKVRDRYEQALKQQHPESTKLRALMGLASEKADAQKNYTAAIQALQALEKVLDASTSAPSGGVDPDAAFKARLSALIPRLKEAQTAGHPGAQEAKLKVSEAGALARKKDFAQANRLLDEFEQILVIVPQTSKLAGEVKSKGETESSADPGVALKARLTAMLPRLKEAIAAGGFSAADIKLKVSEAGVLATNEDFEQAHGLLDEAEALLASGGEREASDGTDPREAGQETTAGKPRQGPKVVFAHAKIAWEAAKKSVAQQLDALQQLILEEFADPESAQATRKLNRILGRFNEGLGDALDELYTAAPDQEAPLRAKVGTITESYLQYIAEDALVLHVQDNPFMPVQVRASLDAPLENLRRQLMAS